MKTKSSRTSEKLEDLPNIGGSIAADLRKIGITAPAALQQLDPLEVYLRLEPVMGRRHDPCVLHTLLSVQHYLAGGEALPWWKFTLDGKELLRERRGP